MIGTLTRRAMMAAAALTLACGGSVAGAQEYKLRIGHANAPADDSVYQIEAEKLKELIEKYSDGKIGVQIFPSGQLGSDSDMIGFVKSGTLDIQITSLNLVSDHAPRLDALFMPYMFPDKEDAIRVIDKELPGLSDYAVKRGNFRILDLPHTGYRKLMTMKPIMTLEELRQIKFRLPPSPVMLKTFAAYGVDPTPIPWQELFSAMQLGVVDGFEVDLTPLVSAHFNEVVKFVTDVDWVSQISIVVMSEKSYEKLPEDMQAVIDKGSAETRQYMIGRIDELLARIVADSPEVTFLGRPDDYEDWVRIGRSVWPEFYERIGDGDAEKGKEIVQRISGEVAQK